MTKVTVSVDNSDLSNKLPSFVKGEFGFYIDLVLKKEDGTPEVLTSKIIKFQTKNLNSITKKIDGTCEIVNETLGKCRYLVTETDMNIVGVYEANVTIILGSTILRNIKLGTFAIFGDS